MVRTMEKVKRGEKFAAFFSVWHGRMRIEFRDRIAELDGGEFLIVPHGKEHRTAADEEAAVLLFEPAATRNTGNAANSEFTAPDGPKI